MSKTPEQEKLEEGLKQGANKGKKPDFDLGKYKHKLTPTQEQMLMIKTKCDTKLKLSEDLFKIHEKSIELENIKHSNILEEIKELKKAKITQFSR